MRGRRDLQTTMLAVVDLEERVPPNHPLRVIKQFADRALVELSPVFDEMYGAGGRPSIPPERLLKASLLISLYSVRSERAFGEELDYHLLFRWFLDMGLLESSFDPTVFTKNRRRLLKHDVAQRFFDEVVRQAAGLGLLSDDHFTVDGTLIDAAASLKSFRRSADHLRSRGTGRFERRHRPLGELAPSLAAALRLILLGAGPNWGSAMYGAAKLWEAGGILALAQAHGGPMLADERGAVVLAAPSGPAGDRAAEMLGGFLGLGLDVTVVGAGNAFCGGWLVGYTAARDLRRAVRQGAVSASFAVGQVGPAHVSSFGAAERDARLRHACQLLT
jgi:transposase